jgi:hemolysin activation/secretion protein
VSSLHAHAQNPPQASSDPAKLTEENLRREEQRRRELPVPLAPDELKPSKKRIKPSELPQEAPCFKINEVRVTSAYGSFDWLAAEAQPFLNQCIGVQGARVIAGELDQALIEHGLVTTRSSFPQQNLSSGVLLIEIQVGRVAEIRLVDKTDAGNVPATQLGTTSNAFPISVGDVLDIRAIEQGVEQMKRLPSQIVTTEIEPGTAPGTSNIVVLRQLDRALRGNITLDNSGNGLLGKPQLSGSLGWDNLLGINDILSLTGTSNISGIAPDKRSQSLSVNYSVPWGYAIAGATVGGSDFSQRVQGTSVEFLSRGRSVSAELRASYVYFRNTDTKLSLYANGGARVARSYIDDVEILVQRSNTTSATVGATFKKVLATGSFDIDLSYRQGLSYVGAPQVVIDTAGDAKTFKPGIASLTIDLQTQLSLLGAPLRAHSQIRAQHTRDKTFAADQFSVGGRGTVRGFNGNATLLAESGVTLRTELAYGASLNLWRDLSIAPYLALDAGYVYGVSTEFLLGDKLVGSALGVRAQWRSLQADLSIGIPVKKPSGFRTDAFSPYLSVTYNF